MMDFLLEVMASGVFRRLAVLLLSPLGSALMCIALGCVLAACRARRVALLVSISGVAWLSVCSSPEGSQYFARLLERGYPLSPPLQSPVADCIVVLGGGVMPSSVDYPAPAARSGSDRVWHAARLFRSRRAPIVMLSGGSNLTVFTISEARAMRDLLLELGVPADAMLLEERSLNTQQNAAYTAKLLRALPVRRVLLVTSAWHMARAEALFRAQGLEVVPAPTDHLARDLSRRPWWQRWLPEAEALEMSARLIKEWVGIRFGNYAVEVPSVPSPTP